MTKEEFHGKLMEFEGFANHMYLDTVGVVTVGIGLALFSPSDAQKLVFMNRISSKMATHKEIEEEYQRIHKANKGYSLNYYKRLTLLVAEPTRLRAEFDKRLAGAYADAKAFYPKFDSLPDSVQFALVDMAYNLGGQRLAKYKNFKKHLEAGDYEAAARESHRNGPPKSRNDAIAQWIKSAKVKAPPPKPTTSTRDA